MGLAMGGSESAARNVEPLLIGDKRLTQVELYQELRASSRFSREQFSQVCLAYENAKKGKESLKKKNLLESLDMEEYIGTSIADSLFNAYDKNKDGIIDFSDYLSTMEVIVLGTPKETLRFTFDLLDSDGDNVLSLTDLHKFIDVLRSQEELNDMLGKSPKPEALVAQFFSGSRTSGISFEEYKDVVLKSKSISGALHVHEDLG